MYIPGRTVGQIGWRRTPSIDDHCPIKSEKSLVYANETQIIIYSAGDKLGNSPRALRSDSTAHQA